MPTSGSRTSCLVDTSIAVAMLVTDHAQHEETFAAVRGRRLGLAGHAAFETFSVLSRLPVPARRSPEAITRLLVSNFPETVFLGPERTGDLLRGLAGHGIAGGAVYDALVAAAAVEHGQMLVTRDRRALATYREIGAEVEVLA